MSDLKKAVLDTLVPNLASVRERMQDDVSLDTDPKEAMSRFFDMLRLIQELKPDDAMLSDNLTKLKNEAREWVDDEMAKRPEDMDSRDLDEVETSHLIESERSIFDDVDA